MNHSGGTKRVALWIRIDKKTDPIILLSGDEYKKKGKKSVERPL